MGVNITYCYSCADSTRHVCASNWIFFISYLLTMGVNVTYCYSCADSTRHVCASNWIYIF
jgi:hypothetical protein